MTSINTTIDLDGNVYIEDVACGADLTINRYPAEPYSWGGSRGYETAVDCTITSVTVGFLKLTHEQAVLMFGEKAINSAEDYIAERYAEEL